MKNSEKPTDKKRVIVVDDSRTQLEMLKYTLENEGFEVESFNNGPEALVALKKQVPDLIITDVIMPGMDGYEVLSAIRAENLPVRVMLLTARQQENDIIRGFTLGADDYVVKPFSPMELVARLKRLVLR